VNISLQMIRIASGEEEEVVRIGGAVLPMIVEEEEDGVGVGVGDTKEEGGELMPMSQAKDGDSAVYFGGDVIQAAQSVIDGEMDKEKFSFLVGASCWEYGQLESEIARGYWLPCRGPPQTTFTGTYDHHLHDADDIGDGGGGGTTEGLWLSAMCALGKGEGDLAYLMSDNDDDDDDDDDDGKGEVYDENGLACDDF